MVTDERTPEAFAAFVARRLAMLPAVVAVTLGGSRATGMARPDSDWDFAVYYRNRFEPEHLRNLGWTGQVFEVGAWGGGVFNGGAWLEVEGKRVDVHYRDLEVVERELTEAEAGRFHIEALLFHVAGIPSYLLLAELALNVVLAGDVPRPEYPAALRHAAPPVWWERARLLFGYARTAHAARGQRLLCLGLAAQATACTAHAVLAARGEWITNEKLLLSKASLDDCDRVVDRHPASDLEGLVDALEARCEAAMEVTA